ncbi:MAG: hypothetical protein FWC55_03790, partial [Firmicutes bacterium]|nr:hypothetical protein [Bacillota bacterium]
VSFEIELQTSRKTPLNNSRFALVFSSFQIETTLSKNAVEKPTAPLPLPYHYIAERILCQPGIRLRDAANLRP